MMPVAAVILAGGAGRRMGGVDKPLLPLGAGCILDHVLAALRPAHDWLAISANGDPARYARFGLPVLPDAVAGQGPLAGILSGLDWAASQGAAMLLSVPGDTPFLPPDLAAMLSPAPSCAARSGRAHPAVALWPVTAASSLRTWLAGDAPRRVRAFGASIGMREVEFAAGPVDPFLNVNTPEDLALAQAVFAASCRAAKPATYHR
jgi:molybdopterin-guanine dinucleotide biosynthesis protein A